MWSFEASPVQNITGLLLLSWLRRRRSRLTRFSHTLIPIFDLAAAATTGVSLELEDPRVERETDRSGGNADGRRFRLVTAGMRPVSGRVNPRVTAACRGCRAAVVSLILCGWARQGALMKIHLWRRRARIIAAIKSVSTVYCSSVAFSRSYLTNRHAV